MKTAVSEFRFNKVFRLRLADLFKKSACDRCFRVSFAKFLRHASPASKLLIDCSFQFLM